jgi:CRP-like cAMP-binding protein
MRKSGTFETETPLPVPIPYHIADPTSAKARVPVSELDDVDETTETRPGPPVRPPSEPGTAGLAKAARRISGMFTNLASNDVAQELETREHVRLSADDLGLISRPPPTVPIEPVDLDDAPTPIPDWAGVVTRPGPGAAHDTPAPGSRASRPPDEDELTAPIEKLPAAPIANAFFVALPAPLREAALARCLARNLPAGTTVIRHGEAGHPLILVVRGQLEVRHDRPSLGLGSSVALETIDAGEFIGEAALLARSPASASVVAVTESDVLAVPSHAVFELAGAYPALWAALKHSAERRMRRYDNLLRSHPT